MNIPFHIPYSIDRDVNLALKEYDRLKRDFGTKTIAECEKKLQLITGCDNVLLVGSCTHALEMCLILLNIGKGDEVICPSFTYVSVVNVILLRGAVPVFIDCKSDTCNIDEALIEEAITSKTKAIIIMHYGGAACNMAEIGEICKSHDIAIIEDAAHCIGAYHDQQHLGTFGDFGAISFHQTKNIHCFQGGALLVNNPQYIERARIIRENGTNKAEFIKGNETEYTWVDIGGNFAINILSAAILLDQLNNIEIVSKDRVESWEYYAQRCREKLIHVNEIGNEHNGHIFYVEAKDQMLRNELIKRLQTVNIDSRFHYIPLHLSKMAEKYKYIQREDYSDRFGKNLLRLPLFFGISHDEIDYVIDHISNEYLK